MYSTVNPKQAANEVFCFHLCPVGLSVCTTRFMHSNLGTAGSVQDGAVSVLTGCFIEMYRCSSVLVPQCLLSQG